jgi:hypothetical protein
MDHKVWHNVGAGDWLCYVADKYLSRLEGCVAIDESSVLQMCHVENTLYLFFDISTSLINITSTYVHIQCF